MSVGPSTQRPPSGPSFQVTKYCTQKVLQWEISSKETSRENEIIVPPWPLGGSARCLGWAESEAQTERENEAMGGLVLKYMWEAPKHISIFCLTSDSPPLHFIMKPAIQVEDPCGVSAVPGTGSLCRRRRKGGRRCFSCSFLHGVVSVTVCFRRLPQ